MWLVFILPTLLFLLVSLIFIIYLYWPRDLSQVTNFEIPVHSEHIVVIAHGVKDSPNNWGNSLKAALHAEENPNQFVINVDWRPFSDSPIFCSVVAKRIGQQIAQQLPANTKTKSLHAIGHSCGAFVVLGLTEQLNKSNPNIKLQSTYLDPVSIYAGFFWHYGLQQFGRHADFSDTYIDTEDGVPGSNRALDYSVTFDVTQIKHARGLNIAPHNWPPHYYVDAFEKNKVPLLTSAKPQDLLLPKGKLIELRED